jgi:D-alanine-D-alanine ligase
MKNIKILVITGGISSEKELSLISGEDVIKALLNEGKDVEVLEITNDKKMVLYSDSTSFLERKKISDNKKNRNFDNLDFFMLQECGFDVAFLALHGNFGEDGQVQTLLDLINIPYTGSGMMASSIGMNKSKCYEYISFYGIDVPEYFIVFRHNHSLEEIFSKIEKTIGFPCVIKPNDSGSSIGVTLPSSKDELGVSLLEAFKYSLVVIVQKFIKGREFACGVLGNTNYSELEVLPVVESLIKDSEIFTNFQKYYANNIEEVCPAKIDVLLMKKIMKDSESVHKILGCDGLSRSDFRYSEEDKKVYFLEINTSPGHTENSICPQEARSLGMTFGEFVLKQINLAFLKKESIESSLIKNE